MSKKTAVIFDLDGTLIHSAPDMQIAINTALQPIGRGPLDLSTVISFVGNGVERLVERSLMFTGGSHPDLQRETVARFLAAYEANGVARTHVYPGVLQQLKHLRSAGLKLGLCTNKPMEPTRHICDALELSPFFTSLVGATPSRPKKPDPAALQACLAELGVSSEQALFVGDSAVDHATAKAAGMDFCLYTNGYLNTEIPDPEPVLRFDDWSDVTLFSS